MIIFLLAFAAVSFASQATSARTWHVKPDGTGDVATIQDAFDAASDFDIVLLAAGTYTGAGNRNIRFVGPVKSITITSEGGPEVTIIDCQGVDRAFSIESCGGKSITLSDITIRNGWGSHGGAIRCGACTLTINNVHFIDNHADTDGGAAYAGESVRFEYCVFSGNSALGRGGAIYVWSYSNPVFVNCTVSENEAPVGAGIYSDGAAPRIENTIVAFNTPGEGFACVSDFRYQPDVLNCDFFGNVGGNSVCGNDLGGNTFEDPLFCGVLGSGNYELSSLSPCAPSNHPSGSLVGAMPVGCSTVAVEQTNWGRVKALYSR
jgi:hypothetical protein